MAETDDQKTMVGKLADVGGDAIQRIGSAPGGDRLLNALNSTRDRMDDMQKKMRGLDAVEQRLEEVERRLDKLEGKSTSANRASSSAKDKKTTSSS